MKLTCEDCITLVRSGYMNIMSQPNLNFALALEDDLNYEGLQPRFINNRLIIPHIHTESRTWTFQLEPPIGDGILHLHHIKEDLYVYHFEQVDDTWILRPREETEELVGGLLGAAELAQLT